MGKDRDPLDLCHWLQGLNFTAETKSADKHFKRKGESKSTLNGATPKQIVSSEDTLTDEVSEILLASNRKTRIVLSFADRWWKLLLWISFAVGGAFFGGMCWAESRGRSRYYQYMRSGAGDPGMPLLRST